MAGICTFGSAASSTRSGREEKSELVGEPHQAAQRSRPATARSAGAAVEVDVVPVIAGDHGDAGKPAFGRFAG